MYKSANQVSEKLLMAVKMNTSTKELTDELATMRLDMLKNNLQTDPVSYTHLTLPTTPYV